MFGRRRFQFTRLYKARQKSFAVNDENLLFQFTRLYKARHKGGQNPAHTYDISIHAPIQGATSPDSLRQSQAANFNSRAYTRRDFKRDVGLRRTNHFNSRAYTRRDSATGNGRAGSANFNSRAYTRRDLKITGHIFPKYKFQFTRLYKARP